MGIRVGAQVGSEVGVEDGEKVGVNDGTAAHSDGIKRRERAA